MIAHTLDDIKNAHPELAEQIEETKKQRDEKTETSDIEVAHDLQSDAALFLLQFGAPHEIVTEKVTIAGREFDIEKLTCSESTTLAGLRWRDAKGEPIEDMNKAFDNFVVLCVERCVVVVFEENGEKKTRPFFTREQVDAMFFGLPKATKSVEAFWKAATRINPNLMPSAKNA